MNNLKTILAEMYDTCLFGLDESEQNKTTLLQFMKQDYDDLIKLRSKVEQDAEMYQEDTSTLDHILDYMEFLYQIIKEISINASKN